MGLGRQIMKLIKKFQAKGPSPTKKGGKGGRGGGSRTRTKAGDGEGGASRLSGAGKDREGFDVETFATMTAADVAADKISDVRRAIEKKMGDREEEEQEVDEVEEESSEQKGKEEEERGGDDDENIVIVYDSMDLPFEVPSCKTVSADKSRGWKGFFSGTNFPKEKGGSSKKEKGGSSKKGPESKPFKKGEGEGSSKKGTQGKSTEKGEGKGSQETASAAPTTGATQTAATCSTEPVENQSVKNWFWFTRRG